MRQILRFIFEFPYKKIGNGFLWVFYGLTIIPVGVPAFLFLAAGIGGSFAIINSIGYGCRLARAYAYREPNPDWQGFLAT